MVPEPILEPNRDIKITKIPSYIYKSLTHLGFSFLNLTSHNTTIEDEGMGSRKRLFSTSPIDFAGRSSSCPINFTALLIDLIFRFSD